MQWGHHDHSITPSLTLKDVAVAAAALAWAAGHACVQAASAELVGQQLLQLLVRARALLQLALHVV